MLLLAVPFAIAEPLKLYGVLLLGKGLLMRGVLVLAFAYLASFLIIERIYHAGRDKLLSIGWFGWLMTRIVWVRSTIMTWIRATALWAAARHTKQVVVAWWRAARQ